LETYKERYPKESDELERRFNSELPHDFNERFDDFLRDCLSQEDPIATRKASQICLDHFCSDLPELIGGSADLTGSNNTFSKHNTELTLDNPWWITYLLWRKRVRYGYYHERNESPWRY
jgi:transketolase